MVLHVHRSERADCLVDALAGVLSTPLADPMAAEIVSVPTRGVERWVAQQLSGTLGAAPGRHDGVCANVAFPFPARLVDLALAAGNEQAQEAGIWRPERLVWPLLEVVEACRGEGWLATLASFLRGGSSADGPDDRRFGAIRHVADLFDRYGVQRPAMIQAWAGGEEVDDHGAPLPADCVWQARLWTRLRAHLGSPSPAELLRDACERLRDDPSLVDLPVRLSLFGVTRVPAAHAEVLRALAAGRAVHLFALHPSPVLWDEVGRRPRPVTPILRARDPSAGAAHNPLLASWGRDAREMQLVLAAGATQPVEDRHYPVEERAATLLQRIQADIRANRAPPGVPFDHVGGDQSRAGDGVAVGERVLASDLSRGGHPSAPYARGRDGGDDRRFVLPGNDHSVSVHSCHGRPRQVEVLRDAILHALADDPTLEPRDVIVMCPDVETFAPLIHASFGAGTDAADIDADSWTESPGNPTDLRVRLADRSLRQTNPVLGVVAELLDLADARLTASQVLDLAARGPVRTRFGFDDDDLGRLEQWVDTAGIRWGLDADHRRPYGLGTLDANTWHAGLDRLLLGAAMSEDDLPLVGGVLPLDDVDSGDLDLAGRLAEMIGRLAAVVDVFARPQPVAAWSDAIAAASAALTATSDGDDWQSAELRRLLEDVVGEATSDGRTSGGELTLPEVRALLADRLRGEATRANFRTGHLTVCTLVPMRSVPHRVVCLLGLDDGLFPRHGPSDGDDLVERSPLVGDRDARSEDRQLLLDAVLAATDALIITYSGRDPRTNAPLPPAVPLGELLDVVDATARTPEGTPARTRITVRHPLQPFDARNFADGTCGRTGPWSFDPVNLRGALARRGTRAPAAPMLSGPLPRRDINPIELDDLVRFVQHPVRAFFRQRLGLSFAERTDETDDALPIELDGLGRWGVGERMLAARLTGIPAVACRAAEAARGDLPPGALGDAIIAAAAPTVEQLVSVAARYELDVAAGDELEVAAGDELEVRSGGRGTAEISSRLGVFSTPERDEILSDGPIETPVVVRATERGFPTTERTPSVTALGQAATSRGHFDHGSATAPVRGAGAVPAPGGAHTSGAPDGAPAPGGANTSGSAGAARDIAVDLGGGDVLVGTVTGLVGPVARTVTFSAVRARQRLAAWVRMLALSAADPSVGWSAVTIGRRQQAAVVATVGPLPDGPVPRGEAARDHLRVLVDLYRRGMTEPLPLYCETSAAWAAAVRRGHDPVAAARREWWTDPGKDWAREDRDADHRWALDGVIDFDALAALAARPGETGPGWDDDQSSRVGRYAVRLWAPLLAHEAIESP